MLVIAETSQRDIGPYVASAEAALALNSRTADFREAEFVKGDRVCRRRNCSSAIGGVLCGSATCLTALETGMRHSIIMRISVVAAVPPRAAKHMHMTKRMCLRMAMVSDSSAAPVCRCVYLRQADKAAM